jgi:ABC-2 type transport system permease protein
MHAVVTLALKDLRLLTREPMALFWALAFPLIFALFFGSIFGGGEGGRAALAIAVVDEDDSPASRAFVGRLEESPSLRVEETSRPEAREAVLKGWRVGYVVIPKGFGAASPFAGEAAPPITVGIDPGRQAEAGYLQGLLMEAGAARMQELFADPNKARQGLRKALAEVGRAEGVPAGERARLKSFLTQMDRAMEQLGNVGRGAAGRGPSWEPVRLEREEVTPEQVLPRTPFEVTFPSAVLWGVLGCVTGFSLSIVSERVAGTWLRLRTTPISRGQILAGKGLACFLACAVVSVLLLLVGVLVLRVRVESPVGLLLGVGCTALCFTGIMMLLSTLGKTESAVAGWGWGLLMPLAMVGGGMIPLFVMPAWLQQASHFSPVKWGIVALEGAIWRGYGLSDMLLPCAVLTAIGVVCFAAGVASLSRQDT